jgi:hypothetical protein
VIPSFLRKRMIPEHPTAVTEAEELLGRVEQGQVDRAARLKAEEQAERDEERQALLDLQARLLAAQRRDADEQAYVQAQLMEHLSVVLRDLEQLRSIDTHASADLQTLTTLGIQLKTEWKTPWIRSSVPTALDNYARDTLRRLGRA